MGAGIAQLAAATGARTLLHDPDEVAVKRGLDAIADGLERWRAKGRLDGEPGEVSAAGSLEDLAEAELIIEAAPERLDLKKELLRPAREDRARRGAGVEHVVDPDHRDRRVDRGLRRGSSACTSSTRRR